MDLLTGSSEALRVGSVAARAAVATTRVARGELLREDDRGVLREAEAIFEAAASTLEFFESGGVRGSGPHSMFAAHLDIAIDVVSDKPENPSSNSAREEKLSVVFKELAGRVRDLIDTPTPNNAEMLDRVFSRLSEEMVSTTSSTGEIVTQLTV